MTEPAAPPSLDPAAVGNLLGYLNFSDGRPDARRQAQVNDLFASMALSGVGAPWLELPARLGDALRTLHAGDSPAFRDIAQADAVLAAVPDVLAAYRSHHADLLAHVSDGDLFGPFFLVRVLEASMEARAAGKLSPQAVVNRLNDFLGHRPVALLETREQGEPYAHERHRPLPLYLRGAGVAHSRYAAVIAEGMEILRDADPDLLNESCFNLDQLDEMALDLRAYDHNHPVNRRPNYVFGEWDPHRIDGKGRYSRYVIRKITLDALMERVDQAPGLTPDERLREGGAVLAGTILMAAGVSGWGPGAHDSVTTLAVLLPRIARYRDAFYERLMTRIPEAHAARLKSERESTRQPFGAARQHLNAFLAKHRATQMQQRYLSLLYAEMGYPAAAQSEAAKIMAVSVRLHSDLLGRLAAGRLACDLGRPEDALPAVRSAEDTLRRGIACGGFADPWNVLGFQGLFPLSFAREDSIRDPRIEDLVGLVEQIFALYARALGDLASRTQDGPDETVLKGMNRLASWWDRFATYEVSDLRRVHGGEAVESATNVARALSDWSGQAATEPGSAAALKFWRDRLDDFRTPRAYALVVEALLARGDHRAALGLLASWVSQAGVTPLEDNAASLHTLALRWMLTLPPGEAGTPALVARFFATMEANAEDYWEVPSLETARGGRNKDDDDDPFGAAYEGMTFKDSTDNAEGAVSDGAPTDHFDLDDQHERIDQRLRFLSTVARLWQIAARLTGRHSAEADGRLDAARRNRRDLLALIDSLHDHALPEPDGDHDSLVEFDRRRVIKEQLIYAAINTAMETTLAVAALRGASPDGGRGDPDAPAWEAELLRVERAMFAGDPDATRSALLRFADRFRSEPLLFSPLSEGPEGGAPRGILRVRIAQAVLRSLLSNLPRLGLLRETYDLLKTARGMEQAQPTRGRGVTEFNNFFTSAYQAVVESVVRSSATWSDEQAADEAIVDLLERATAPFLKLWIDHSKTLQLSVMEGVTGDAEWRAVVAFVQRYGSELFHTRFMTLGNLRGIIHRGVRSYLDYLETNQDPLKPSKLVADLDEAIPRGDAVRRLELVMNAVVENYEEYRDYNTTTTQSDYGENLHVLLDFLRLKAQYERHAWQFRPLVLAHEILARQGRASTALRWEEQLTQLTRDIARRHLANLAELEKTHGVKLSTVSDRLHERYTKPLALDRLCALVEPCLNETRTIDDESRRPAFVRLRQEARAYTANPSGVGLDVPGWLKKLTAEVGKVRSNRQDVGKLAENFFRAAWRTVSHEEVRRQLDEWDRPALPS